MTPDGKNDMILSVPAYLSGRYAGCADMAELADATVLGAVFERSAGSSPVIRIKNQGENEFDHFRLFACMEWKSYKSEILPTLFYLLCYFKRFNSSRVNSYTRFTEEMCILSLGV